jgi:hypothetical protein
VPAERHDHRVHWVRLRLELEDRLTGRDAERTLRDAAKEELTLGPDMYRFVDAHSGQVTLVHR